MTLAGPRPAALVLILVAAAALRIDGVAFGLPALNDPDEPLFMMTAFEMLRDGTLNPGWFGHPGTVTLYSLALVVLAVAGLGMASGRFAGLDGFAAAVYADPGIVFLPARLLIVACGVASVLLTYRIGKRLGGSRLGLVAAGFLAVNAVHIEYSQIIRTDVQAGLFMLLCTLSALSLAERGRWRDYLLSGVFAGAACATKWPAAVIGLAPALAGIWRVYLQRRPEGLALAALVPVALTALFAISPYLLLDYPTVLQNLAGEARALHPGATGHGLLGNLAWYTAHPLLSSLGAAGLVLAATGLVLAPLRDHRWALAVLPGPLAFLVAICAQPLLWERWIVPLLPYLTLAAAWSLLTLTTFVFRKEGRLATWSAALAALLLALPMLATARGEAAERQLDTRQIAAAWVRKHVPPGSTILIEHAAFDLLKGPWEFRFPLGSAGCVDARRALSGRIRYAQVETVRSARPIVDVGHVDLALLPSCRADFALLTYYDRYLDPAGPFAAERERYARLLAGGRIAGIINPERGNSTGPTVYIARLRR